MEYKTVGQVKYPQNLDPEKQAIIDKMARNYAEELSGINKDNLKNKGRIIGGSLVSGASFHPFFNIPYVGTGIGGAMYDAGQGIVEGQKLPEIAKRAGRGFVIGETVGAVPYVGKLASKTKAGQAAGKALDEAAEKFAQTKAYDALMSEFAPAKEVYKKVVLEPSRKIQQQRLLGEKVNPLAKSGSDKQYLTVGRRAENINQLGDFDRAFILDLQEGYKNPELWKETGWFKGVDGDWRYEIPNGKLKENINWQKDDDVLSAKLSDIYDNPTFFEAYPKAKELTVNLDNLGESAGNYNPMADSINLDYVRNYRKTNPEVLEQINKLRADPYYKKAHSFDENLTPAEIKQQWKDFKNSEISKKEDELINNISMDGWNEDALDTLHHELQHYIQDVEHFASGGSPKSAGSFENYKNLAGEVEARTAGKRAKLSEEELKKYMPFKKGKYGYDVAPTKQILSDIWTGRRYGTGKVYSLKDAYNSLIPSTKKDIINSFEQFKLNPDLAELKLHNVRNDLKDIAGTNDIYLLQGNEKGGIKHILKEHPEDIEIVADTLKSGNITNVVPNRKVFIESDDGLCIVSLDYNGKKKSWLLTGYQKTKKR